MALFVLGVGSVKTKGSQQEAERLEVDHSPETIDRDSRALSHWTRTLEMKLCNLDI